jgi:hypothetical protein
LQAKEQNVSLEELVMIKAEQLKLNMTAQREKDKRLRE